MLMLAFCICVSFFAYWIERMNSPCSCFHLPPPEDADAEVELEAEVEAVGMDVLGRVSGFVCALVHTASCLATRSLVKWRPHSEQATMAEPPLPPSSLGSWDKS